MRLVPRAARVFAGAILVVGPLAACSSTSPEAIDGPALQRYSCCSSGDLSAVRHPGETVELHWLTTPLEPSANYPVSTVRLSASMSGPFSSVSALKSSALKTPAFPASVTAPVVVTTDQVGEAPVSVLVIPTSARAGYYNLTTTIDQDGGQLSAGAIIQVAPK